MLEICYLAKGEQTYRVGSGAFHLHGGDVFITFPGESHGTGRSPEEKGDLYWLILDTQPDWEDFPGFEPQEGRKLRERLLALQPRQFRGTSILKTTLDDIFATFTNEDFAFRKTAIANSLVRFLLEVVECERQASPLPKLSQEIAAIKTHIERSLTEEDRLNLDKLASLAGMSLSCFKARFRHETGIPPAEYITRRKLECAARLLAEGHTVTYVAFELGFSSSQHFSTVFRRFKGKCPGEFRGLKNVSR
jgi:AraC-like DNA-binding protein